MKKNKILFIVFLLITSLVLIACGGKSEKDNDDKDPDHIEELTTEDLKKALEGLKENYELEISVLVYDELEAEVSILVDGNKSSYKEGEHIEFFYIREGQRELTVIEKKGNTYVKSAERERKDRDYDLFNLINENWYEAKETSFKLKEDNVENLLKLFKFSEDIELISSTIKLDDKGNLQHFNITFEEDRDTYYLNIKVKNINNVSITIPEVR